MLDSIVRNLNVTTLLFAGLTPINVCWAGCGVPISAATIAS